MSGDEIRYYEADDNGVEVAWEGADRWLVGTWRYDAISGTIRDVVARMAERASHGDEDWAPLKAYQLGDGGTLRKCSVHTHISGDHREVHVVYANGFTNEYVASARFMI